MSMRVFALVSIFIFTFTFCKAQSGKKSLNVIAYYFGDAEKIKAYPVKDLTHIIFSFCHLKGNKLEADNAKDTAAIRRLVSLKKKHPDLKVMLALGGWGGCGPCSDVFSTSEGRLEFVSSVRKINDYFQTDGIDLDWEYPAIEGYPGHKYQPADKTNFTALIQSLRDTLGPHQEISFAAGASDRFLEQSVEWEKVVSLVDRINLMTYDLVGGYSKVTGHHTALYSTADQGISADHTIRYLKSIGIPMNKLVLGAAFYARTWENVENVNNGLYQAGKFKSFVPYVKLTAMITGSKNWRVYYDSVAHASYAYNKKEKLFATFDDPASIREKTKYTIANGLNGIMFWELTLDKTKNGLLEQISQTN